MPAKTLFLTSGTASGSNHHALQDGGSAPTGAVLTTGWIVGSSGTVPRYAVMDSGTERAAAASTTTVQPAGNPDNTLGDCFRTDALTGTFVSGNWSFSIQVQGETRATSTHDGRLRIRVYRSANATGTSPTEITAATQVTSTYTDLTNSTPQTLTLTWAAGQITLNNEYLFIQIAHQADANGGNANCDTHIVVGASSTITTTNFVFPQTLSPTAIDSAESFPSPTLVLPNRSARISWAQVSLPVSSVYPQTISPGAINSSEIFGTPLLYNNRITPDSIGSGEAFGVPVVSSGGPDIQETFESAIGSWTTTQISSGSGTVTQSSVQALGANSARLFTTASGDVACIGRTYSDPYNTLSLDEGRRRWQHAWVYIPSTTISALTGTEYLDLGGFWESGAVANGWRLRVIQGGELYAVGKYPGPNTEKVFRIYGTIPTDQWFELELGLWSNNGPISRSFCAIVNGTFYGWYTYGHLGTGTYDRVGIGILRTNSADDLIVYVDNWAVDNTGTFPAGSDDRPATNSFVKDYTQLDGSNNEIHYATWWDDARPDASYGLRSGYRVQGGVSTERMPSLDDGWTQITIKAIGTLPAPGSGDYYAPMIAFHKRIPTEHNLEIQVVGNYLHFDVWDGTFNSLASWQLPIASNGQRVPDNNDKVRLRWYEVSTTNLRAIVDYYDASAASWNLAIIDHTANLSNWSGENFLDTNHKSVSLTIDSASYGIADETVGILSTFPGFAQTISDITPINSAEAFGTPVVAGSAIAITPDGIASVEAFGSPQINLGIAAGSIPSVETFETPKISLQIAPGSISSTEVFGTPVVIFDITIAPSSISSAEIFGSPQVNQTIKPNAISGQEVFGIPALLPGNRILVPTSIDSAEAFGAATISPGVRNLLPASIDSAEVFGAPALSFGAKTIVPNSITSSESFETPTVVRGTVLVLPGSIDSAESFASPTVQRGAVALTPGSIASGEAFGLPQLSTGGFTLQPSSITSAESFDPPVVQRGAVALIPASIGSQEAFATPTLLPGNSTLYPGSIGSQETFGVGKIIQIIQPVSLNSLESFSSPAILPGSVSIAPTGIPSAEAFGEPNLGAGVLVHPVSIQSQESFGQPDVLPGSYTLAPSPIASAESFPSPAILLGALAVQVDPIASQETIGSPVVIPGSLSLTVESIPSGQQFGIPSLQPGAVQLHPVGIESQEAWGTPEISNGATLLVVQSILSSETFGVPSLIAGAVVVQPQPISSGEAFGLPSIALTTAFIQPTPIDSAEAFGNPTLHSDRRVLVDGIPSGETWGTPTLEPGPRTLSPSSISSAETFGSPKIQLTVIASAIPSAEAFGSPTIGILIIANPIPSGEAVGLPNILPGSVSVLPSGIASAEAFETPAITWNQTLSPQGIASAEGFGIPLVDVIGNANLIYLFIALAIHRQGAATLSVKRNAQQEFRVTRIVRQEKRL